MFYELGEITTEIKLTYQAEVFEQLRRIFEYKLETLVNNFAGIAKNDKSENTDYTAGKLEFLFGDKYLPTLRQHDEIWRLLNRNCTN